ncbi:T9SS type A sorting domain-containing protein [Labilibacter sediminis]|nr:T9SS type A sorting domain-containing protein [Labilibacter sediminis]
MKRIAFLGILLFILLASSINAQQTFFVSPGILGDDTNNNGLSPQMPYKTIAKAIQEIDKAQGGICYLMEGVYREEVLIDGYSNLDILPYQNANVVLDGTEIITSTWNVVAGMNNVYKAEVPKDMWQLFINDEEQIMARWPNTTFENNEIYKHEHWAVNENNAPNGTVNNIVNSSNHGYEFPPSLNANIAGGMIVANFGSFRTWARGITSDISGNSFAYATVPNGDLRTKHRYYFIEGKLHLLDTEDEWFFQEENGKKYVYAWSKVGDGSDLNDPSAVIRGKVQSYAIDIRNSTQVTIKGLKFFGTTIRMQACDYSEVLNCIFSYPNYSKRMLKVSSAPLVTSIDQSLSTGSLSASYGSSYCKFDGCVFEYTDGEAFICEGDNHIFNNNYIHHIDWSCASTQSLGLTVYAKGSGFKFTNNVLHTTGASATLNLGTKSVVKFNDMSDTGYAQSDGSVVQHTTNSVAGSETAYNWIHDTGKYGFRFDAPAKTPCTAGEYGLAHHNVIWNIGDPADNTGGIGMMIKGDHQQIYNNTVFNCLKTDILIIDESCGSGSTTSTNNNSYTRNNWTDFISGHRTSVYDNVGDIPGIGVTNNVSQWKDDVPTASTGSVDYDVTNLSIEKPVYHYFSGANNGAGAIQYDVNDVVGNRANYDFNPKSNQSNIINAGFEILSTKLFGSTEVDVNITNDSFNPQVGNPDVGAYELGGNKWIPGIDFLPELYPWTWPDDEGNPPSNDKSSGFINRPTFEYDDDASYWSVTGPGINGQIVTAEAHEGTKSYTILAPNENWDGIDTKTLQNKAVIYSDQEFNFSPDFTASSVSITVSFWIKVDQAQDNGDLDRIKLVVKDLNADGTTNFVVNAQIVAGHFDVNSGWQEITYTWNNQPFQQNYKTHIELWLGNLSGNVYVDDFSSSITNTSTSIFNVKKESDITLFPQPASQGEKIYLSIERNVKMITVYSLSGNVVLKDICGNKHFQTSGLNPGFYMVMSVLDDNTTHVNKIVVQ